MESIWGDFKLNRLCYGVATCQKIYFENITKRVQSERVSRKYLSKL